MRNNHVVIMAGGVDSRSCDFLLSDEGKDAITQLQFSSGIELLVMLDPIE